MKIEECKPGVRVEEKAFHQEEEKPAPISSLEDEILSQLDLDIRSLIGNALRKAYEKGYDIGYADGRDDA